MVLNLAIGIVTSMLIFTGNTHGNGCNLTKVQADIVFLLDSSSSINDTNFKIILQFVKNFIHSVTIGPDFVRVAVFKYAYMTSMEFGLNAHSTSQDIDQAVDNIQRTYGGTSTHSALKKVHEDSEIVNGNTRPNVTHFLLLITDGYSNNKGATQTQARLLREDGVEISTIGITSVVDKDELLHVASSKDHFFYISDFYMLQGLISKLLGLLCDEEEAVDKNDQGVKTSLITVVTEIAAITGCGVALIGVSVCCARFLCFRKRKSDDEDEKKLQYMKERSSTFSSDRSSSPGSALSSRTPSPTLPDNRVSPMPFPVVTKAKPLPMTDSNAFIF